MKMKEIGPGGRASLAPPLRSATVFHTGTVLETDQIVGNCKIRTQTVIFNPRGCHGKPLPFIIARK